MDIIVTTPKSMMADAAAEAEDCKRAGGGQYFRRFGVRPPVEPGDRIYYVEDGYVRGFALVTEVRHEAEQTCETSGHVWSEGWYVFMDATTWQWIRPIPMRGFQGFRMAYKSIRRSEESFTESQRRIPCGDGINIIDTDDAVIVGNWLDPKPVGYFQVL